MMKVILVRHGPTDWNKNGRIQGQLDIPLNEDGRKQIQTIISGLAHIKGVKTIDAIYSSGLSRSWETAEEIAKVFNLKVRRMKELNELDQGVWQGLLENQVMKRFKKLYAIWQAKPLLTKPPQGESLEEASKRVICAVEKIVQKSKGLTVCIVGHQIVSAVIKSYYKKTDINMIWNDLPKNASWEVIEIKNE